MMPAIIPSPAPENPSTPNDPDPAQLPMRHFTPDPNSPCFYRDAAVTFSCIDTEIPQRRKIMKTESKILIIAFLCGVALFPFPVSADNATMANISIENIKITPPASGSCQYRWEGWVKNNNTTPFSQNFTVQSSQGGNGYWGGVAGMGVSNMASGETRRITSLWIRKPGMTAFKVVLRQGSTEYAKKEIQLPQEPAVNASITNVQIRENGYTVSVKNNASHPVTELTVQCYMASASSPENWKPCGGSVVACIPGGGTGQRIANFSSGWKSGYELFKFQLTRSGTRYDEKIQDLRPKDRNLQQPVERPILRSKPRVSPKMR